jgi:hypothetical protein
LALFGRIESSVPIGTIHQGFEDVIAVDPTDQVGGALYQSSVQAVPTLALQFGLNWTPTWASHSSFRFGYTFEHWWNLGEVRNSQADLTTQGLFFRGQFNF